MAYRSCLLYLIVLFASVVASDELLEGSGEGSGEQPSQQQLNAFTGATELVTPTVEAPVEHNLLPVNNTADTEDCLPKVDIVFVLDTSGNIEQIYKEHVKWTVELVDSLPVRKDAVRIAALQYAGSPITEFSLGTYSNGSEVSEHLKNIAFQSGVTRTGIALRKAEAELFHEEKGARIDAAKIIILFTDGLSIDDPLKPAQQLRDDKKVKIYVVSVGSDGFEPEMNRIAGIKGNVYGPKDLQQLKVSLQQDIKRAQNCPLTSTLPSQFINGNLVVDNINNNNFTSALVVDTSNMTVVVDEGTQVDNSVQHFNEAENITQINAETSIVQQYNASNLAINQEITTVNGSLETAPLVEVVKETVTAELTPGQSVITPPIPVENIPLQPVPTEPVVTNASLVSTSEQSSSRQPEVVNVVPSHPEAVNVVPPQPEAVHVVSTQPEVVHVAPQQPEVVHPVSTQSEVVHPVSTQPEVVHPVSTQPEVVHPVSTQPEVVHPVSTQPEAVHPVPPQPEAHVVSPQPETVHPVPPQPEAVHVVSPQPEAPQVSVSDTKLIKTTQVKTQTKVEKEHKQKVSTETKTNETIPLQESIQLPKKTTENLEDKKIVNNEVTIGKAEIVPENLQATGKQGPLVVEAKVPLKPVEPSGGATVSERNESRSETTSVVVAEQSTAKSNTSATQAKVSKGKTEQTVSSTQQQYKQYSVQYPTKTPYYPYETYSKKPANPAEPRRQTTRRPTTPKPNIRRTDGTCPVDILFIVDSSGSVRTIYEQQKQYVYDILEETQISDHEHRTALVQFAGMNHQRTEWNFDTFEEKDELMQAFANVRHFTGTTFIGRALETALKLLSTRRAYVPTVVVLLSDGFSQDDATLPAGTINRSPGVDFYAVSISDLSNTEYLETLTGDPGKVYIGEESEELKRYLIKMLRCEA